MIVIAKYLRNENGLAMPLVLVVLIVLVLLGTAIWQYSIADTQHVYRDEQRMKAHYMARAGADAALEAWITAEQGLKPTGTSDPVYFNNQTGLFVEEDPGIDLGGSFIVTIGQNAGKTEIVSTGYYNDVTQKVIVEVNPPVYGHDLGWYDYKSGQFNNGSYTAAGAVILEAKDTGNSLQALKNPNSTVSLKADALFFLSPLGQGTGGGAYSSLLELRSDIIVFLNDISINKNSGDIVLFGFSDTSGKEIFGPDGGKWGAVYFPASVSIGTDNLDIQGKAFYFPLRPEGVSIRNNRDLLRPIENPVVPTISSYSTIIWKE